MTNKSPAPGQPEFDVSHHWQLNAHPEEISEIVFDTAAYNKWCARILLGHEVIESGDAQGLGLSLRFYTKGWLPYSFLFRASIVELIPNEWMRIEVSGDFVGFGELRLEKFENGTSYIQLRWMTDIHHPQLRPLVRLFHPVMKLNHIWAVAWMRRMMQAEILRRRAGRGNIAVPKPTFGGFLNAMRNIHNRRADRMGWRDFLGNRGASEPHPLPETDP
ncbi:MAG: hypothetical protein GXP03_11865 [Alphaproteobacteria bacterium]|nr:hypothetical protein [Alphaproteobacteria bacterium]